VKETESRFDSIHVKGFRRLFDVELHMRPLTIMIGINGSGKTSFLNVWSLLSASSGGQLNLALSDMGGITENITRDKADSLVFELSMTVPGHSPLMYHLKIEPQGQFYQIAEETLTQENSPGSTPFKHIEATLGNVLYYDVEVKKLVRPNWEHNIRETALSEVPKMFREPENLRKRLSSSVFYSANDFRVHSKAPVRMPQPVQVTTRPGPTGDDLVSFLYYLRETDHDRFDLLSDTISTAFPDFERLDFPPVAAGVLAMTWKDKNFSKPMYVHQLSEGTLRFLWLASILISPDLPALTLIDEPEMSMHPGLLDLLVDLMRQASKHTQLIIATHSDRLIRFSKPDEVAILDVDNGQSTMTWADTMDLDHWLAGYSLDQVWMMNRAGGWR
jgi:predicted ATPase